MKMRDGNRALGKLGEDIAARFLSRKGYRITARNVRTYLGEVDIVAKRGLDIIFVEVKARKSTSFGPPYLAITSSKKRRLIQSALCYLKMKKIEQARWQIDVVSIELDDFDNSVIILEHFENAVHEERG